MVAEMMAEREDREGTKTTASLSRYLDDINHHDTDNNNEPEYL